MELSEEHQRRLHRGGLPAHMRLRQATAVLTITLMFNRRVKSRIFHNVVVLLGMPLKIP